MTSVPKKAQLKSCAQSSVARKKKMEETAFSSDSEEESDVDMEANFALLTKNNTVVGEEEEGDEGSGSSGEEEEEERGEGSEEEERGEGNDEEERGEGSDEEEEERGEGSDEDDDESESSDEDDEGGETKEVDGGGNTHTEDDVKKELSAMSFEDILKLQQKVGMKAFSKMAHGSSDGPRARRGQKRLNKNRPIEVSSKRYVPFLREVVAVKKSVRRDPRFDDLSGEYKPEIFEKTYRFINDIRSSEKEAVKKMLKTSQRSSKKEQLRSLVLRMENQERSRRSQEMQREKELEFKRKQKEQAALGLQPFYLNKGEQNKLQLAEKYEQLKRSGKLENFLTKKRKRNATKDRKKLPYQNYNHQNP
ncbi:unnamed protein product [Lota lota]